MAIGYVIGGLLAQRLQRTADFSNIGENSVVAIAGVEVILGRLKA
ncbi:unknown [Sutterella sp. CAG:521]|nr:unknown [Sutterella sp. CAG:521]